MVWRLSQLSHGTPITYCVWPKDQIDHSWEIPPLPRSGPSTPCFVIVQRTGHPHFVCLWVMEPGASCRVLLVEYVRLVDLLGDIYWTLLTLLSSFKERESLVWYAITSNHDDMWDKARHIHRQGLLNSHLIELRNVLYLLLNVET